MRSLRNSPNCPRVISPASPKSAQPNIMTLSHPKPIVHSVSVGYKSSTMKRSNHGWLTTKRSIQDF